MVPICWLIRAIFCWIPRVLFLQKSTVENKYTVQEKTHGDSWFLNVLWNALNLRYKDILNRFEPQKKPLTFHYTGCLIGILTMAYYNHGSFDDLSPSHGVSPSLKFRHQWSHAPPDWGVLQSETPRVWMWHFWKHRKASQKKKTPL